MWSLKQFLPWAMLLLGVSSCTGPRPLKGGKAFTSPAPTGGLAQSLLQGDNPSAPSRQEQESIRVRTYTLPAGTRIEQHAAPPRSRSATPAPGADAGGDTAASQRLDLSPSAFAALTLPSATPVVEREETRARTELGAAQKDTARELAARLSSLKGIVWVGLALFLFGLGSLFWPPLKALVNSVTTSLALAAGGVALMFLPTFVVGHEVLLAGGVATAVGGWFLAHRHGQLRGLVAGLTSQTAPAAPQNSQPHKQVVEKV